MLSDLLYRLRALFRRDAVEGELDEELRFHFEQQVQKLMQTDVARAEAVRRVRLTFGGIEQVKEECRDARGVAFVDTVFSGLVAASWPLRVFAALPDKDGVKSTRFHEPEKATAQLVSANYFSALGIPALTGRTFLPEEDQPPGEHPVVVLSYQSWQN